MNISETLKSESTELFRDLDKPSLQTFQENIDRDVILLHAALAGGLAAVNSAAMLMPDFAGGPDTVTAYAAWMADPARRAYRAKVASEANPRKKRR